MSESTQDRLASQVPVPEGIHIEVTWLTPEMASRLLGSMAKNRPVSKSRVAALVDDIRSGRYIFNPNPIVVDDRGALIDGQHRCCAVFGAAQSIPVILMRGFPHETMDVIDTGKPRSISDIMRLEEVPVANRNVAAGAVKATLLFERYPDKVWAPTTPVSKQEILRELKDDPERWAQVSTRGQTIAGACPSVRSGGWVSGTSMAAALNLIQAHSKNIDLLGEFEKGIRTGEMLATGDPRLTLRSALNHRPWGITQSSVMAIVQSWNKFVQEEPMKLVRIRQSMLPMPKPL